MRKQLLVALSAVGLVVTGLVSGTPASAAPGGSQSAPAAASTTPIYLDTSYTPAERAADLTSRMTIPEKAAQMDSSQAPAIPRLGVAAWGWWNEANHGINASTITASGNATTLTNTTSYPSDLSMGSSWNPDLVYAEAKQIGAEARDTAPGFAENLDFYAPTVNLSRDPRWGRNDESWSEDPTLTANLASQYVDGLQGQTQTGSLPSSANGYYQAIATLKHYAANNSEVNRLNGNSVMTQKQLREYYTAQFANIVQQSHPGSIMSSYNEVNGTPAAASVQLIDTLARQTFGFNGYFTSDCDAVYEEQAGHSWVPPNTTTPVNQYTRAAYSISAGEDLDCNAGYSDGKNYANSVPTALTQNIHTLTDTFNVGDVDTSLVRLFTARIETGEFDAQSQVPWVAAARARLGGTTWVSNNSNNAITETPDRLAQAQSSADQGIVMLRNNAPTGAAKSLLPLAVPHSGPYKIAVVGYYGHPSGGLFLGGYSSVQASAGSANNIDSYQGVKSAVQAIDPDATVDYLPGVTGGTSGNRLTTVDAASVAASANYDAVVVVVGTDSSTGQEAQDRTSITLPGAQASLISQVEAANPNTIVYMETMGLVDTSTFAASTPSLLWSSYNGQRQGAALADVLTGKVDATGHLPFTWYANVAQIPPATDYNLSPTSTTSGRTYQFFTGAVAWPMGYGLSYASYKYSNLQVSGSSADANDTVTVKADVTNTGDVTGSTVPQLYVTTPFEPASAADPAKRLEGFQKISLDAGQTKTVTFTVPVSKLAFYDTPSNTYKVDAGTYGLQVSSSAADADVQLQSTVAISGSLNETPTVLTAKPVQTGDTANDVAQRVMFDAGTTINPQLTVGMNDQQLYGYVTKGQSTALPSGLTVSYTTDRPSVVSVGSDQSLHTVGAGVATVTATVSYHGVSATTTFTVDVAPLAITSNASANFQQGVAGTATITSFGMPKGTLSETGALPNGLTFTDNGDGTATIAGTTTDPTGNYPITVTAHNGVSADATQTFTIVVGTPSVIGTTSTGTTFVIGIAHTATVTTTGFPTATITESGTLPSGVTFVDNKDGTATFSGTAANNTDGVYPVTISATNGIGTKATATYTITVLAKSATPTAAVLSGRVTDSVSNAAINGACVYVYPTGNPGPAAYATCTRSNGSYELDGVAPGSYTVAFTDPSGAHATQWYTGAAGGASSQSGAATVTVTSGQFLTGLNAGLVKVPTGNVSGTVTDATTKAALANVCVYLYPVGTSSSASYASCTLANGTFVVPGVTAGNYNAVFVDPTGAHVSQWYTGTATGSATQAGAKSIAVANGNATVANVNAALVAVATGNLTGKVTDASSAGIGNVCVYLYPHGVSTAASYATCTASDGTYSFGSITPAAYDVVFYDPQGRYTTQWYTGTAGGSATQSGAVPVTVPSGNGTVGSINATESSVQTGIISGTVTDASSGTGLGNECVYLYPVGTSSSASYATCTATAGTYSISGVASGSYNVAFSDPTSVRATQWYNGTAGGAATQAGATPVVVPSGNGTVSGINAALSPVTQGNVTGTVTDAETGTPAANVCVYLYAAGNSSSASYATCTGNDGKYSLSGVTTGSYNAAFFDPQGRFVTQWFSGAATQATSTAISVPNGNQTLAHVDAAVARVQSGSVSGAVTSTTTGAPLANICVYLYPAAGGATAAYSTCTLKDGTYSLAGVATGSYDVAFFDPNAGYTTQWYSGAATQATATPVVVPNANGTVTGINAGLAPRSS